MMLAWLFFLNKPKHQAILFFFHLLQVKKTQQELWDFTLIILNFFTYLWLDFFRV